MRVRKYKNKLIAINMIREFLVKKKRFPSRGEIAAIVQDNHIYDENWAPTIKRLTTTNPSIINFIFNKLRLHLDIAFMYIQSFALESADKFISNTVRLSRVNRLLDHIIGDAFDWSRRVYDDNMCMIHRTSMKLMKTIKPGSLTGTTIDHDEGCLLLARHKSKRITVSDSKISYSAENGSIKITGTSTPSAILNHSYDTSFVGIITSNDNVGIININLEFPTTKRFNILDVDLVIPARIMLYSNDKLIADTGVDKALFQPTLMFRYITTDNLRLQIHQPGPYKKDATKDNEFQFGIRSISLTRCEYVATGTMDLETIYSSTPIEADYIAIETVRNHSGEVVFNINNIKGGLLKSESPWTISRNEIVNDSQNIELKRGEIYHLENTVFNTHKFINPESNRVNSVEVSSDHNIIQEDTSSVFGIESVSDPIWGTKLWKFTRAAIAGPNKDAIIPGSLRMVPTLYMCKVQSYNFKRSSDYVPMIEDWHMDDNGYNIAIHDLIADYKQWLENAEVLSKNGIVIKDGMNLRIDMYIKSTSDINQNIIIYDIIGLQSSYYFDNIKLKTTDGTITSLENMFKSSQVPIVMKANKWHKFTILIYSTISVDGSVWDPENLMNPWSTTDNKITVPIDATDISQSITQLYDFVNRNNIIISGTGSGELVYVELADLPFVPYPAYSMNDTDVYLNINIDKKAGHGSVIFTWKEWKTGWDKSVRKARLNDWTSLMSMHNPAIVNSIDVSVNLSLLEQGLSPSIGDVVVLFGKKKAADPILKYLTGDNNV